MPLSHRRFGVDEESGKRDDDRKPSRPRRRSLQAWLLAPRFRRRRFLGVGLLFLFGLVLFAISSRLPKDGGDYGVASKTSFSFRDMLPAGSGALSTSPPAHDDSDAEEAKHYHNGPLTFPRIGVSLSRAARWRGFLEDNRNVLFVAGSLRSMTALIPLACEMARWRRSDVHFAYMGRDDVALHDVLRVNGVKAECGVNWHDARADHATYSSNARMRGGIHDGLQFLHEFIHPQVLLVEKSGREDEIFLDAVQQKAKWISTPVIPLPDNAVESMMWITRLDSGSLSAWNRAEVEILVHAPERSSGGLIRLLKSLASANYISSFAPHITIELPAIIDPPLEGFLNSFTWPPDGSAGHQNVNRLSLRHRIHPKKTVNEEDISIESIETFYPHNSDTHVLILSPQAELSSHFYQYLKYTLLEYKYSSYGAGARPHLLGISLELPTRYVNDTNPFTLPLPPSKQPHKDPEPSHFLWQAPNSHAALYFGDKWLELHDFVRRRFEAQQSLNKPSIQRQLSKRFPQWMEYLLELSRARGYHLLYPHLGPENALVTIHNELYQHPLDQSSSTEQKASNEETTKVEEEGRQEGGVSSISSSSEPRETRVKNHMSLLTMFPGDGDLLEMSDLTVLTYDGYLSSPREASKAASSFAMQFRRDVGGCGEKREKEKRVEEKEMEEESSAADLFCLDDEDEEDDTPPAAATTATAAEIATATAATGEETKGKEMDKNKETKTG